MLYELLLTGLALLPVMLIYRRVKPHRSNIVIDLFIMYCGIVALYLIISGCTSFMTGASDQFKMEVDVQANEGQCDIHFDVDSTQAEHTDDKEVKGPGIGG